MLCCVIHKKRYTLTYYFLKYLNLFHLDEFLLPHLLFRHSDNFTKTGTGWTIGVNPCSSLGASAYFGSQFSDGPSYSHPAIQKNYKHYKGNSFCRTSRFRESQASNMSFLEAQLQQRQENKIFKRNIAKSDFNIFFLLFELLY